MAFIEVIKYNGTPDLFAWKFPSEELGTWTQLVVNESQEAVLFKGGQALDLFTGGTHTLDTANVPILRNIINIPFGGRSPFTAEVWYVNKVNSLDIKWGTATPIQIQDPKYKVFVPVRSYGQFGIQIADSKKFLIKLVGTLPSFDKRNITDYFKGLYLTKVKDAISSYVIKKQISVLEINAYLDEISQHLKNKIMPTLSEYGINLVNFYVNDISVPEDDMAVTKLKEALAKRAEMDIIGYNYTQERSFDTLEGAATNPGSTASGLMGAGIGLGVGMGVGGGIGQQMGAVAGALNINPKKKCPKCNADMDADKRFCGTCGCDTQEYNEKNNKKKKLITCSKCGETYPINAKFCPACGNPYNPCPNCKADLKEDAACCDECGYIFPKKCPKCKAPIDANARYCPECGTQLFKKCPKCNSELIGTPKFCPECGEKLDDK